MLTTINVTSNHIKKGRRRNCFACPVSLAINDVLNFYNTAGWTDGLDIKIFCGPSGHSLLCPPEVALFIRKFDDYSEKEVEVGPFSFELDIPEKYLAGEGVKWEDYAGSFRD